MRILILTNSDIGLYKFRKELIEELLKSHEVYIALPKGEFIQKLQEQGCQYLPFEFARRGMNPFADLWQIHRYRKLLQLIRPGVVLTYTIKPNIYGGIACQKEHIPYIANVTGLGTTIENGGLLSRVSLFLYYLGLKKANCVFFQNVTNQSLFIRKRIVADKKSRLISGSGVNLEEHCLELYPNDENGLRFLFVGRIMRDKGIGELLQVIVAIHAEDKRISLDIVGDFDEQCWSELLKKAEETGAVRYHGRQNDVHPFYRDCHCVVLPSYHEGMANVLLEGAATGRPVIASAIPGCQEAFDEAVTGFGCAPQKTESLLTSMRKFIALSQVQRETMGIAARTKIEREFDRKQIVAAYLNELQRL